MSALALGLGVAGCAESEFRRVPRPQHPVFSSAEYAARHHREAEMNRQWQNRPLAELLEAYGKPTLVMHIPGGGMPPSFAVVYEIEDPSGCIDAFAVHSQGEPTIRIYHCR